MIMITQKHQINNNKRKSRSDKIILKQIKSDSCKIDRELNNLRSRGNKSRKLFIKSSIFITRRSKRRTKLS